MRSSIRQHAFFATCVVVVLCFVVAHSSGVFAADAATLNTPANGGNQITLPGMNLPSGQGNLTPDQMKSIMAYRYLQSRGGRGQVQRGVPQFVPFGSLGFGGNGPLDATQAKQAGGADPAASTISDRDAKKEAAKQKRVEALKAAAEKTKAAREARAQQRKAQQGQAPAADPK